MRQHDRGSASQRTSGSSRQCTPWSTRSTPSRLTASATYSAGPSSPANGQWGDAKHTAEPGAAWFNECPAP